MPRRGTMTADIVDFLSRKKGDATIGEICKALSGVRRSEVLPHSVRATLYRHLGESGEQLFVRLGRGRYGLK